MSNLIENRPVQEKLPITWFQMIEGHLGCANRLFDRTCPSCKGMYSSHVVARCPKCGQALTFITTTKDKVPMAISEGTFYPRFPTTEKEDYLRRVNAKKNGMEAKFRFKMFSFADPQSGVLSPPANHHLMVSGTRLRIVIINHQDVDSWYMSKKEDRVKVERMLYIFPNYGDKVDILPRLADTSTTSQPVDTSALDAEIASLNARIAAIEGTTYTPPANVGGVTTAAAPAPIAVDDANAKSFEAESELGPPWKDGAGTTYGLDNVDVFGG